jgi:hypothetical protein
MSQHSVRNKNHSNQTRHRTQPSEYLSNTPGGMQAFASQRPDPHLKAFPLISILQVGCCVALHPWVVQGTIQHIFQINAGGVYTTCVLFSFLSSHPQRGI